MRALFLLAVLLLAGCSGPPRDGSGQTIEPAPAEVRDNVSLELVADGFPRALMLKYDGVSWTRVDVADPTDGHQQWFRAMSVTPGGDVWALGQYYRPAEQAIHVDAQRLSATSSCPADFDGDGELTIFDFLAFQNAFDAGDLRADFDSDGELTIFDFLEFQNQFDAGCA